MKTKRKAVVTVAGVVALGLLWGASGGRLRWGGGRMPTHSQLQAAFPGDSRRVLEQAPQLSLMSLDPRSLQQERLPRTHSAATPSSGKQS